MVGMSAGATLAPRLEELVIDKIKRAVQYMYMHAEPPESALSRLGRTPNPHHLCALTCFGLARV